MKREDILSIEFEFENCEDIIVPIECFKTLRYKTHGTYIIYFNADIVDNGNSSYGLTFDGNNQTPIQRISKYNDITHICFVNSYNNPEQYTVIWHDNKFNEDENDYQNTESNNYNEVHLFISKYNLKYSFDDIFTFPVGTTFRSPHNILYTIQRDNLGKYLSSGNCDNVRIHKSMVNDKYIKLDKMKT